MWLRFYLDLGEFQSCLAHIKFRYIGNFGRSEKVLPNGYTNMDTFGTSVNRTPFTLGGKNNSNDMKNLHENHTRY